MTDIERKLIDAAWSMTTDVRGRRVTFDMPAIVGLVERMMGACRAEAEAQLKDLRAKHEQTLETICDLNRRHNEMAARIKELAEIEARHATANADDLVANAEVQR